MAGQSPGFLRCIANGRSRLPGVGAAHAREIGRQVSLYWIRGAMISAEGTIYVPSFWREGMTMRCPHCAEHVLERWQPLLTQTDAFGKWLNLTRMIPNVIVNEGDPEEDRDSPHYDIMALWMECPNGECRKIIITVRESFYDPQDDNADHSDEYLISEDSWFAYPKRATDRPVHPNVPDKMASDYREASAILSASPKASAAISRRILADVLKDYGEYSQFQLSKQIDAFVKDAKNPQSLRDNLAYLPQIGDFAAHTQKDTTTGEIVDVEEGEAEWMLDVLDDLFEHYIVTPARHKAQRAALDAKLDRTGRKPIRKKK